MKAMRSARSRSRSKSTAERSCSAAFPLFRRPRAPPDSKFCNAVTGRVTARGVTGRDMLKASGPANLRWFWSLHGIVGKPPAMRTDGRAPTLDEAKAQFEAA
jgi:hypothetical protein